MTTSPGTRRQPARGFTLVEVMVVATLGSFILLGMLTANLQVIRSQIRITHYADMETQVRRGLEQLGLDLRSASAITWNNANDITLTIPTTGGASTPVTYAWSSESQSFFRVPGTSSSATTGRLYLVQGIPTQADGSAGLTFARFGRDGQAATTDLATKRIVVTMSVQRKTTTMAVTSENAVSASFIMRNKSTL
ncbi:MAG: prepilin-type N-terminal cleavage/methylation domain-containing protein [Opitutae bacterium]|nr:prepilin-type N-terminal cleavage/methylation domain-containing protein [Opitutae bacterium]